MLRPTFSNLVCAAALMTMAMQASPSASAAAGETWQSLVHKAQVTLHVPTTETAKKADLRKVPFPETSDEDLKKGRDYLLESIKLPAESKQPLQVVPRV